jgi:hypothetical protein
VFERAKTVHILDLAATVVGLWGALLPSNNTKLTAAENLPVLYSKDY